MKITLLIKKPLIEKINDSNAVNDASYSKSMH